MVTDIDPAANAYWIANNMEPKRYEYDLGPADLVIDLGGFQGEFSQKIHDMYGCEVIIAEPTGSADHMANHPWARVIRAAVSTDNRELRFGGMSYYTTAMEIGDQVYPCFDVMELMDQEIGLLKVNIEGMEWEVMKRILEQGAQKYVKYFQVQFHKINEASDLAYAYIATELNKTHICEWRVPYVWESWRRK